MDTLDWVKLTPTIDDMDEWSQLWAVHDEPIPHIRCRRCDGSQPIHETSEPFVHGPLCTLRSAQSKFPWRDLQWIMRSLRQKQ